MVFIRFGAALFALVLLPLHVSAAPTTITVVGQGSASSMPDIATLSLTISTNADSAAAATSQNNAVYDRLTRAFAAVGVAGSAVRTTSFNVNYNAPPTPQPGNAGTFQPPGGGPYGYNVSRGIEATVRNTALVGKAIDAAIGAGVNNVDSVSFGVANPSAQRAQALRSAVANARTEAQAIAAAAGMHIIGIKTMQEGYVSVPAVPMAARAVTANAPTEIPPSNVSTQASVTITFNAQ